MHDNKTTLPEENPQVKKPIAKTIQYDSNPFTAAWSGVQKLIRTNASTVVGVAFFNLLLFALTALSGILLVLSIGAYAFKHTPELLAYITDQNILDFLAGVSDTSLYATWGIGTVVCIFLMALTQSIQLNLTVAAAKGISLKFGALLKAGVRTVMPILGLIGLAILIIIATFSTLGALSGLLGIITLLFMVMALLAIIFVGIRLSYAAYSIVDLGMGPINAMKHSWRISDGHFIETISSAAVASIILTVPSIILQALARVTQDTSILSSVFGLLDVTLTVVLIIIAAMAVSERYVQLQALHTKQATAKPLNPLNFLAILIVIFLTPIMSALSPQDSGFNQPLHNLYENSAPAPASDDSSIYRFN